MPFSGRKYVSNLKIETGRGPARTGGASVFALDSHTVSGITLRISRERGDADMA